MGLSAVTFSCKLIDEVIEWSGCYTAHVVCTAIVNKQVTVFHDSSVRENHVWHDTILLEVHFRFEDWGTCARQNFHRIIHIQEQCSDTVDFLKIHTVVNQQPSSVRLDWRCTCAHFPMFPWKFGTDQFLVMKMPYISIPVFL